MRAEAELGADGAAALVMFVVAEEAADFGALESDGVEAAVLDLLLGEPLALEECDEVGMGGGEGHAGGVEELLPSAYELLHFPVGVPAAWADLGGEDVVEQLEPVVEHRHRLLSDRRIPGYCGGEFVPLPLESGEVVAVSCGFGVPVPEPSQEQADGGGEDHDSEGGDHDDHRSRVPLPLDQEFLLVALFEESGVLLGEFKVKRIHYI